MHSAYLQGVQRSMGVGTGAGLHYIGLLPGLGTSGSEQPAKPWGQKISSNDKFNKWKLFIGQVPLEVRVRLATPPPVSIHSNCLPANGYDMNKTFLHHPLSNAFPT